MPNRNTHIAVGGAVGAVTMLLMQMLDGAGKSEHQIDWSLVALGGLVGAGAGVLPDVIEPATDPGHRRLFHSAAAGYLVFRATCGRHTEGLEPIDRQVIGCLGAGYLSHLAIDSLTPAGIRLI